MGRIAQNIDGFITVKELFGKSGKWPQNILKWIDRGDVPVTLLRGVYYIPTHWVSRWEQSQLDLTKFVKQERKSKHELTTNS